MKKKSISATTSNPLGFSATFRKELALMAKENKTTPGRLIDKAIDGYIKSHKLEYIFKEKAKRKIKK